MLKIAITGNIACGKSQVEKYLTSCGYKVYDSDIIAHNILNEITEFFGYDVFTNGKIDRQKLGKLVFNNTNLKKELENIIHPKVKNEIIRIFKESNEDFIFISIPLLFETGFDKMFDKIIFVQTNEDIQLKRLMKRNNLSQQEALLRINSQEKQDLKIKNSDFILHNNSSIEDLHKQILILIRKLTSLI